MLKAQASLEQLVVIAAGLAFVGVALFIAVNYSADSLNVSQSQDAVERLSAAANHVYALGPNSKEYVDVYLSQGILSTNVSGKRVLLSIGTSGGKSDIFSYTNAQLVGSIPAYRGRQKILVEYLPSGQVLIGEAGLSCSPDNIERSMNAGGVGSDTVAVSNMALFQVVGINASLATLSSLASVSQQPPAVLAPGASGSAVISYSIPSGQRTGTYAGMLFVSSANGATCLAKVTLHVNGTSSCSSLCASQGYANGTCRAAESSCIASGEDHQSGLDYSCSAPAAKCCCAPTQDVQGPLVNSLAATVNPALLNGVDITAVCNDSTTGGSYIAGSQMQVDGSGWSAENASDGSYSDSVAEAVKGTFGLLSGGSHLAAVRCTDTANNTGPVGYLYFNLTTNDTLGPIILSMNHSGTNNLAFSDVVETGTATDAYTGGNNVAACYVRIDSGGYILAAASDGAYNSPTEGFTYDFGKLSANTHTVYAYCKDSLGNAGGVFSDTFGIAPADVMLAIESSNSMSGLMISVSDSTAGSTTSTNYTKVRTLALSQSGNPVNITAQVKTSGAGCKAYFQAQVGSDVVASGSTTSTTYTSIVSSANLAGYGTSYNLDLYMKSNSSSCTASENLFSAVQQPTRIAAAQQIDGNFVDLSSNTTQIGIVDFKSNAVTDQTLTLLGSAANKTAIKNAINSIGTQGGNICIACGIDNSVAELTSARGRYPNATRTIILASDGPGNVGDEYGSAADARAAYVIIYTVGIGNSAITAELTNIALITGGKYYYAPDYTTLSCIMQHIGEAVPPC